MPSPVSRAATHWRCHHCNSLHLWQTTPACITCDHRRCPNCIPLKEPSYGGSSVNASTRTAHPAQRPGAGQNSEKERTFWKCHRCLTQCPKGSDTEKGTWNCKVCHHSICWECSASFENAAVGMNVPALRAALGPDLAALQRSVQLLGDIENSSPGVVTDDRFPAEGSLSGTANDSTIADGSFATDDEASIFEAHAAQAKDLQKKLFEKTFAFEESQHKLNVTTQALEALLLKHDELLATLTVAQMPLPLAERKPTVSEEEINTATQKDLSSPLLSGKMKLTTGLDATTPTHPIPSFGRDGSRDTPDTAASSPLEEKVGHLSLGNFHEMQRHQKSLPNDEISEQTESDEEFDTPCESDGELDFAGPDPEDGNHIGSPHPVDPRLLCDIVNQLISAYLKNVSDRHAGQRQCAATSGSASVSHNQPDTESAANDTNSNEKISSTKHERAEERDNSVEEAVSHKRSKKGDQSVARKLFACPYWKFDKRRYSEHNMNEKHYRHCSSTYSLTIHRLKQHLYRVHKRPEFYCSRCFTVLESRERFDGHSRASAPCHVSDCPFEEKMTHDQMAAIRKRAATRDQVATWYFIYEILFPGSSKPDSPYADDISPEGVEDFEQWFIGQELVLRDLFATRIASDLPLLPPEERNILDTALEECLFELARTRGRDFYLPPADAGPSNWIAAEFEIQGTTALEVAEELEMRDALAASLNPRSDEDCPAKSSSDSQQETIAEDGVQESDMASSPVQMPQTSFNQVPQSLWEVFAPEDWAIVGSSLPIVDTFGEYMEALGHDVDFTTVLQQNESEDEHAEI